MNDLLLGWAVFVTFRVSMRDWLGLSENRFQLTIDSLTINIILQSYILYNNNIYINIIYNQYIIYG